MQTKAIVLSDKNNKKLKPETNGDRYKLLLSHDPYDEYYL